MFDTRKKRPVKKKITAGLFRAVKKINPNKPFRCFFCLPSTTCLDIETALDFGVINYDTKIIAVENNPKNIAGIKKKLQNFTDITIINKNLEDISRRQIGRILGNRKIDICYLDTCSCLTTKLQNWIEYVLRFKMTTDGVIITNVIGGRHVKDIAAYNLHVYDVAKYAKNKWASAVATCLHCITKLQTVLLLSYKESGSSMPMILSLNSRRRTGLQKFSEFQNLGYEGNLDS